MKQETNTMQAKEGLHTQGEWLVSHTAFVTDGISQINFGKIGKIVGCTFFKENSDFDTQKEAEANAELIVKAVNFYTNERQALLDLLKDLNERYIYCFTKESHNPINHSAFREKYMEVKEILNNAKNISG